MKKIAFLGDSITEGACASSHEKTYSYIACEIVGATELNYGVGGTRIARQINLINPAYDEDFLRRMLKIDKSADFVFMFGGTNDFGHGDAPFGVKTDETPFTFYGALNLLTKYLLENFGKEKLCYILPLHRFNEDNAYGEGGMQPTARPSLSTYKEAIKTVAKENGIDVLCFDEYYPVPTSNNESDICKDGLHPNDKGHRLLGEFVGEYLRKKL